MNSIRPLAGALLATLMCAPAMAEEVHLIFPGGLQPDQKTEPAGDPTGGKSSLKASAASQYDSSSQDYPEPVLQTRHFGLQVELSCTVASEPNALAVINHSAEDLPPGTRIKWQIKSEGKVGYFALIDPLNGGQTLVADNVLPGSTDTSAACVARVI